MTPKPPRHVQSNAPSIASPQSRAHERSRKAFTLIAGGHVVSGADVRRSDVLIQGSSIIAVGDADTLRQQADMEQTQIIDAKDRHVLPGLVDVHVHFREPGATHKEDFHSGSSAAAIGGVTTVLEMPNTNPPVNSSRAFIAKDQQVSGRSFVDYGFYGVLDAQGIERIEELAACGAIGFKLFLGPTTGDIEAPPLRLLLPAFERIAKLGLPIVVHAEDRQEIEQASRTLQEPPEAYRTLLRSRPRIGELVALSTALLLGKLSGAHVHIAHVALAEAVELIRDAKASGQRVSAETGPHYLLLDEEDCERVGAASKVLPPVRSKRDQEALWTGMLDGTLDVVATDHAPHLKREKARGSFLEAPGGIPGLETLLPIMLTEVHRQRLNLTHLVANCCERPASLFGLETKGVVAPGMDADIVIVDLDQEAVIDSEAFHSKSDYSPFHGYWVRGIPDLTMLRGEVIAENGALLGEPVGRRVSTFRSFYSEGQPGT